MAPTVMSSLSLKEVGKQTWAGILADDVLGRAAQLAYFFFLALFPFLVCVLATLGVLGNAERGRALLFEFFAHALPPAAFEVVNKTFGEIIQSSGALKMSLGILASLWSASVGMTAAMDTLNAAYNVKETRSLLKQYVLSIGITMGIGVMFVISVTIVVFGDKIVEALAPGNVLATTWKIAQWPVAVALLALAFAITYYFAPNLAHPQWHWISPGAVAGVLLWLAGSLGLRVYLHFFNNFNVAYGSLGAVIILFLWFYLSGIAVLSGAVLNGVLEHVAPTAPIEEEKRGVRLQSPIRA